MTLTYDLTERQQTLLPFTEGITVFEGRKGSGKSTSAVALLWYLREEFGLPSVCDFPLKEAFGEAEFFDLKIFIENLRFIAQHFKASEDSSARKAVDELMEKGKIPKIVQKAIFLDEGYQYADSREPGAKDVKLFGYWIQQIRHFQSPLIMVVPHLDMIDKRVRRQVDRVLTCETWTEPDGTRWTYAVGDDISLDEQVELYVNASVFQEMFDSWVLTPIRGAGRGLTNERTGEDIDAE